MHRRVASSLLPVAAAIVPVLIVALLAVRAADGPKPHSRGEAPVPTDNPAADLRAQATDEHDQAQAEHDADAQEAVFQVVAKHQHAVDTPIIDACTGKPITTVVGTTDVTNKAAQCVTPSRQRTNNPPAPPVVELPHLKRPVTTAPADPDQLPAGLAQGRAADFARRVAKGLDGVTRVSLSGCGRVSRYEVDCIAVYHGSPTCYQGLMVTSPGRPWHLISVRYVPGTTQCQ